MNASPGKRVGLFGGTFNPPHLGHEMIAQRALSGLGLDVVIWIPAGRSPLKSGEDDVSPGHRLAMVSLATAGHDKFKVSDIELRRPPPSFTVDTVSDLTARHPDWELFLLVGQDSWDSFDRWKNPGQIAKLARIAVYPRLRFSPDGTSASWEAAHATGSSPAPASKEAARAAGSPPASAAAVSSPRPFLIDAPLVGISSTRIRDAFAEGTPVDGLLRPSVHDYIRKYRLYG